MWILKFLPDWIFYALTLIGLLGIVFSKFVPVLYRMPAQVVSVILLAGGLFMVGAAHNNAQWEARVKELELKLAQAEIESQKENTKIIEKIVYKNKVVKERGAEIIKYIDKEIVKYDNQCVIPKEFIDAHNKAAKGVK